MQSKWLICALGHLQWHSSETWNGPCVRCGRRLDDAAALRPAERKRLLNLDTAYVPKDAPYLP